MSAPPRSVRRRRAVVGLAIAALVVLVALVAGAPPPAGPPLDPNSTSPAGTKALVLLLRSLGAEVHVDAPVPGDGGVAVVLEDVLDPDQRDHLRSWVDGGGTLVVADPGSELAGAVPFRQSSQLITGQGETEPLARGCDVPALRGVQRLDPAGDVLLRPGPGDTACFGRGGGALLLVRRAGRGTVVDLGGPGVFVNRYLGHLDNSVLAASLMAPVAGTSVSFVGATGQLGRGRRHLLDLIAPRLKEAFWQLVVAFGLLALARGRRFGPPVPEEQPVELPGSELVVAVGNLLHQGRRREQAARILRDRLRRHVAERMGLPAGAAPDTVADAAEVRAGMDRDRILGALIPSPLSEEGDLVALAQATETIRQEVDRVR